MKINNRKNLEVQKAYEKACKELDLLIKGHSWKYVVKKLGK